MKIILVAFGSRGDVEPFLALAVALHERGHHVTLAAPGEFEAQVGTYHIPYICIPISNQGFFEKDVSKRVTRGLTPAIMFNVWREVIPGFKRAVLTTTQMVAEAARNADLLISHAYLIPTAYTIYQQLHIPLMLSLGTPIVPSRMFSMFPSVPFGQRIYNPLTFHVMLRGIYYSMIEPVNTYRKKVGLPPLSSNQVMGVLVDKQIPFVMHYSRHLMPAPPDWGTNVHIVGKWTLPAPNDWTPSDALISFLAQGEPPVFIGFGSMPVPAQIGQRISNGLRQANMRGILQRGWGGLAYDEDEHLITIDDTPHDWLFPHMAAIVHHGGSGTTHAALRAGKPSLVVPFMADQPFWGRRLAELGVGVTPIAPKKLTPEGLAAALRTLTQDSAIQQRAAELGALLRTEDGLLAACELVEQYA